MIIKHIFQNMIFEFVQFSKTYIRIKKLKD